MQLNWRSAIVVGVATVVLWAGGCGNGETDHDDVAPRPPGEVDIDGGTVRFRSDDGESVFELDDRGEVRVTDDDGETILTHGEGTVLPEEWPEALALPDGLKLTSASTMNASGELRVNITGETAADPATLHEDLKQRLDRAGFAVQGESFQDDGDEVFATISAAGDGDQAAVTLTGSDGSTAVAIFLGLAR